MATFESETVDLKVKRPKKKEPGIIYLSTIPPLMTVDRVRQVFKKYGEIGRIFLQPKVAKDKKRKKRPSKHFTEGWVEFMNKRKAKLVAQTLNNTQVGGKRRSEQYDYLWNIKYLHRFKWTHLSERLAYEKAVHMQRVRTEVHQAKKLTNYYIQAVDKDTKMQNLKQKLSKQGKKWEERDNDNWDFKQERTSEEVEAKKRKKKMKLVSTTKIMKTSLDETFLKNVFPSSSSISRT